MSACCFALNDEGIPVYLGHTWFTLYFCFKRGFSDSGSFKLC